MKLKWAIWAREFITPRPSVLDLFIAGMLAITFFRDKFQQGMFFVFYSIFILILTFFMKPKRDYISIPLVLLVLWSFIGIFIHNKIKIVPDAFINQWFVISIMFEGFIYILAGFLLFRSIVNYSTNLKFIFLLLPVFAVPLVKVYSFGGRITIPTAFLVSVVIWLFVNKKYILSLALGFAGAFTAFSMWPWIQVKFACRPYVWKELLRQITEHPFVGSGFDHRLTVDNMVWVREINGTVFGWIYRHCDPLSLAAYLGIASLAFLTWLIIETIFKTRKTIYLIPILTMVLAACFQMTFFESSKAAIGIVLLGICVKETYKEAVE